MSNPTPKFSVFGSLVVKATDSWPVCHDFEPGTTEDPPCRRDRYTLNMSMIKRPPIGVVWKLGLGVPDQMWLSGTRFHQGALEPKQLRTPSTGRYLAGKLHQVCGYLSLEA
ncbi:hypothetical protein TNCV_4867331 [Trichonephila clavipes]|nr:hypothetical protein TNCV_4867331 [Trichonephila clavipes]